MLRRGFLKVLGLGAVGTAAAVTMPHLSENFLSPDEIQDFKKCDAVSYSHPPDGDGWVRYKFHMTASLPPDRSYRIRYIEAS